MVIPGIAPAFMGTTGSLMFLSGAKRSTEIGIGLDFRKIKESVKRVLKDLDPLQFE